METSENIPKQNMLVTMQDLGDEMILYDSENEKVHVLNHTALAIWNLCNGSNTFEQILESIQEIFPEVPPENLRTDARDTLADLREKKLIL